MDHKFALLFRFYHNSLMNFDSIDLNRISNDFNDDKAAYLRTHDYTITRIQLVD